MSAEVRQGLFDRAVKHVIAQGRPSGHIHTDRYGETYFKCDYRSPDGCKCAAGIFVTSYDPHMENRSWTKVVEMFPTAVEPASAEHNELIECLQDAHDVAATYGNFVEVFKERARRVAAVQGVSLPLELR